MPVLKPTGAPVPKPEGGFLAESGEPIAMSVYWHRRVADGSVMEITPPQPEASPPTQPATKRRRSTTKKD